MNKELIEDFRWQAMSKTVGPTRISYSFTPEELERFTELIVKECANVAAEHSAIDIYEEILDHWDM